MKRRKFNQSLATSIAGLSLASGLGNRRLSFGQKKLGIALVGLGNYATRQLAPALLETQMCALKGLLRELPQKLISGKRAMILKTIKFTLR